MKIHKDKIENHKLQIPNLWSKYVELLKKGETAEFIT